MSFVPCAVCGRDSKRGSYNNIPLCLDCYINRADEVLAYEAVIHELEALRDIHTDTDAVERSHLTDAQWAEYVKLRDATYAIYGQDENQVPAF